MIKNNLMNLFTMDNDYLKRVIEHATKRKVKNIFLTSGLWANVEFKEDFKVNFKIESIAESEIEHMAIAYDRSREEIKKVSHLFFPRLVTLK